MLHDIIYALLGFTGEVVVSSRYGAAEEDLFLSGQSVQSSWLEESQKMDVFQVQDGYPFLTEAEREQINRIVPLGWFYNRLQGYVESYDMSWTKPAFDQEVYKMALAAAIQDLLQEYVSDIARLEELINQESTLPLSHFLQHVQKVSLFFFSSAGNVCVSM